MRAGAGRPSRWIVTRPGSGAARMRLFCFPYAGGGASIFRRWTTPPDVEICAVQLPGREDRFTEPPSRAVTDLIPQLAEALQPFLDRPYAFFGHSMGAIIAFELASQLAREHRAPAHLFVSGRRAPHLPARKPPLHTLPDAEFERELGALNGTPRAVLDDRELMALMAPILRADFTLCETYGLRAREPIDVPIDVFGGTADPETTPSELEGWREHTRVFGGVRLFPGDHFYLQDHAPALVDAMLRGLRSG